MHPELDSLVKSFLSKGEITERGRELLIKKAEQLGVDALDFEIELEQIIIESKSKSIQAATISQSSPTTNKEGIIKKCPACGSIVESFNTTCKDCGHEFRDLTAAFTSQKLDREFSIIEAEVRDDYFKNGRDVNVFPAGGIIRTEKRIPKLNAVINLEIEESCNERKIALIKTFPIPNSKEDILEILAISIPEAKRKIGWTEPGHRKNMQKAWLSKAEQIIIKARIAMKDDKKTLEEIESYAKQLGI